MVLPFLLLRLLWRGRKNRAYYVGWSERFALYRKESLFKESIWIHAVSLGEVVAAIPLVRAVQKKYPSTPIVFTVMTPAGAEQVRRVLGDEVTQLYVPYDYPYAVKKFLNYVNPKFLIIMETELWPNILYYSKQRRLPVFLVNARLTERSFKKYCKISRLTKMMLGSIDTIFAQSQKDADYFLRFGIAAQRVNVSGNIKFDIVIPADVKEQGRQLRQRLQINGDRRPIWIAASTHAGEEAIILTAFKRVLLTLQNALLILVPRHVERCREVAKICQQRGFSVARYVAEVEGGVGFSDTLASDVMLVDVTGRLLLLYAASDVALVGGSLVAGIGGHNVLEPAALALPILVGPYTESLADVRTMLENANGLIGISNADELAEQVLMLLTNAEICKKYGNAAWQVVEQNRGIIDETVKIMQRKIELQF